MRPRRCRAPAARRTYFTLIKAGRWLAREHPDRADPAPGTRELAAAWVAAVDRMLVGEFSQAPNTNYMRAPLRRAAEPAHQGGA